MKNKMTDPEVFLKNLVSRKGKSELYGVTLTSVNVLANVTDSTERYKSVQREISSLFSRDKHDWNELLVDTRLSDEEIVFPIAFHRDTEPVLVFFIVDGNEMDASVSIPKLTVGEFAREVTFYTELLRQVAQFAGKTPRTVKFLIGAATLVWDDMVEEGYAESVEVGW